MRRPLASGLLLSGWLAGACLGSVAAVDPPGDPGHVAEPILLRIGLATDLPALTFPWSSRKLQAEVSGRVVARLSSLRIEPAAEVVAPGVFRLQAAALKDEGQARGLAERLAASLAEPADVVFDAGSDLYRVRVGRYDTRELAERAQRRLALLGLSDSWVVSEKGALRKAALRLIQADRVWNVPGRWLALRDEEAEGVRVLDGRYRGRLLIYLNDRGLLNVINELPVEEYLRGVVPREMGPEVFDSLEALKAQTVAARTYTLRNLGEFADEGYDLCATPRCQVYGGMGVEHPLTDRAIRETAGEVLVFDNEMVDALYSSTCGGHTEDSPVIFPLKDYAYLKGVPCLEAGVDRLTGRVPQGTALAPGLMQRLLPPTRASPSAQSLGARLEHLALLAGLPIPEDRLRSLERREVQRFIASICDLALDVRLFVAAEDLPYLLDQPPPGWDERDLRLAAYLVKSGLLAGELDQPLTATEIEETLFRLALYLGVLVRLEGRFLELADDELSLRVSSGEVERLRLPESFGTYRMSNGRTAASSLSLLAGDRIDIYLHGGRLLAVAHRADADGVAFDRTSNLSSWSRFRSDHELSKLVEERYPGLRFRSLEILERGVSGRVGRLRLLGADGESVEVQGLAVRWTLDLPDTLFTAKRQTPPGRPAGWLFKGRGWGHGVGMCQVGAFGMAQRGHSYREILLHYYTGVEIVQASSAALTRQRVAP